MSLTYSSMIPLGASVPDFSLPDAITGKDLTLGDLDYKIGLVVMFICNHCPYVLHVEDQISKVASVYKDQGVGFVAISSNDVSNYPDDDPEGMRIQSKRAGFTFPYLYDHTQEVAKAFGAECTPDFFVFDRDKKCVYRGRLDASSPGNGLPNDGADLRQVLDNLLAGNPISSDQKPSMGCNIKWK